MTTRELIKLRIIVSARKLNISEDRYTAFKQMALGVMDTDEPELVRELDRLETVSGGITRLINEAWNRYVKDRQTDAVIRKWEEIKK